MKKGFTLRFSKPSILLAIAFIISHNAYSQTVTETTTDTVKNINQYIIGFSPSKATHTYGLNLFLWFESSAKTINGIDLNLNPVEIIYTPFVTFNSIISFLNGYMIFDGSSNSTTFDAGGINGEELKSRIINGIYFGMYDSSYKKNISGINLNVFGSISSVSNGITISGVINSQDEMNGISFAVLGNNDLKVNGVQIGLTNFAKNLNGFQIGLWNTNEKRSLPFINWNF